MINTDFWNDSMQFYNHGLMRDGTYQKQKCILGGAPVYLGVADPDKALLTAQHFSNKYFSTDWGVRMVGYDSPYFFIGGYNYGNIWPLFTGCASWVEYNAGLRMQGFRHAYSSLRIFGSWDYGNVPEVIAGDKFHFSGICSHQQWSSSMNILPLYEGMLGLRPDALKDSLGIAPAFPAEWSYAKIKNIRLKDKRVALDYNRLADGYQYQLTSADGASVPMTFSAVLPLATQVLQVEADGQPIPFILSSELQNVKVTIDPFTLAGKRTITLRTKGGVAVLLNLAPLEKGMPDDDLKIEAERFNPLSGTYDLHLAGIPGKTYRVELLTLSDVASVSGGTLTEKPGNRSIYTVTMPKGDREPFVNHILSLNLVE